MNVKPVLAALAAAMMLPASALAAGSSVTYEVNGEAYEGYWVSPADDAPLVLLIHDWDGLTDYEVKRAEMLAEMGYAVFAADLYKDREKMRALMNGALQTAAANGANTGNAVAMGYCFGGAAVLELARSGADLDGFATFHGGLGTPDGQDYSATKGAVLVMHGTADSAITMEDFAALATELEAAGVEHEMITYSGAPHAFTVFGSDRYREDADMKSWERFGEFLQAKLKSM